MDHPAFFDQVRRIRLCDPLIVLLGISESGIVEYSYLDAVKLAGHSCPTVAGTYLMLGKGLDLLWDGEPALRGGIRVSFPGGRGEGVTGVMACLATLITGATADDGFKGLGGLHDRRGLLFFGEAVEGDMRLERVETGAAVHLAYSAAVAPPDPRMSGLARGVMSGTATADERRAFASLWQDRVRRLAVEHGSDERMIRVTRNEKGR